MEKKKLIRFIKWDAWKTIGTSTHTSAFKF